MNAPSSPDALLLCLDMQPVFVRAIAECAAVQHRCAFALAAARGLDLPIIFTEQVPAKLGGTAPDLLSLAHDSTICAKDTFSAYDVIEPVLRTHARQNLLICGIETPVCVYQTALDALHHGHTVTVLRDAVGGRRPADGQACLDALARAGAKILPAETVFYALIGSVAHPFFKPYTQLVKSHG